MTAKLTVTCTAFKPLHRNTLIGFASIHIAELRLTIHDVAVHQHEGGARWAQLPSKPMLDRTGVPKRNAQGKIEYSRLFEFDSRAVSDAFSKAVIDAVLAFEPRAFDVEFAA